jgi:hypothetical protein
MEIFTNQEAAHAFAADIRDPKERLLTQAAIARALHAWLSDAEQASKLVAVPIDLLAFARGVHAFFRDRRVLEGILNGSLTNFDELSEVF